MNNAQTGKVGREAALDLLRERFDARLATLSRPDASARLRSVLAQGAELGGHVRVEQTSRWGVVHSR